MKIRIAWIKGKAYVPFDELNKFLKEKGIEELEMVDEIEMQEQTK